MYAGDSDAADVASFFGNGHGEFDHGGCSGNPVAAAAAALAAVDNDWQ